MGKNDKLPFYKYIICFAVTIAVFVLLLFAAAFLPQDRVDAHLSESIDILMEEEFIPASFDYTSTSQLDNFSESLILSESKALNRDNLKAVFTNPKYLFNFNPILSLSDYLQDSTMEPANHYVRYWLGSRVYARTMLTALNYLQIRRVINISLFFLIIANACLVGRKAGINVAFAFALSIFFVRPQVIGNSMQFSICFMLGLLGMLAVPWLTKHRRFERLMFMELGMLTMYFDFYTTPLVSFGLPAIFLFAMDEKEVSLENEPKKTLKNILCDFLAWFSAYVLTWISKLALADLFTDIHAIKDGLTALTSRLGLFGYILEEKENYSAINSFRAVINTVFPDTVSKLAALAAVLLFVIIILVKTGKKELVLKPNRRMAGIILIAALPLLWFAVAAEPTIKHTFFQYRNIAVTYWALMCLPALYVRRSGTE